MIGVTRYILFFSLLLLTACDSRKPSNDLIRVALLRGPSAIAFAGWMEQPPAIEGKTIEITLVDSPDLMHAILLQNKAEIAILPMINAANLYTKSIPYKLAGCPVWGNLYLVEKKEANRETDLYIFGAQTTPDILTRYYCETQGLTYSYNYTLGTPGEIAQGLYAGKVQRAVLGEPYLSMVLHKEPELQIKADLNNPQEAHSGFAQTAILVHPSLEVLYATLDSLFALSSVFAREYPSETIRILEEKKVFPVASLTEESIERCRIEYRPVSEAKENIRSFLELIYQYEPKALGGKLPDEGFYN